MLQNRLFCAVSTAKQNVFAAETGFFATDVAVCCGKKYIQNTIFHPVSAGNGGVLANFFVFYRGKT